MYKTWLALLLICILGLLSGCQPSNTENSEKNSETERSETEISSETEIEGTENSEAEDETENTEDYTATRYELVEFEPTSKLGHTKDLVVFDTKVYAILHKVPESNVIESDTNPYYLVSFDKDGSNYTQVNLETPTIENDLIMLKHFTIGQDQRIYALKVDYVDMSSEADNPALKTGLRLVCWNLDGTLHSDILLTISDTELPAYAYVTEISISKNGAISLYCNPNSEAYFMACLNQDGTISKIVKDENTREKNHFIQNNDGSLFSIRTKTENRKLTHSYYLAYDVNTQEFLPEVHLKDILIYGGRVGENIESLYFVQNSKFYNYNFKTQEKHLLIDLKYNQLSDLGFNTILPITENSYICIYSKNDLSGIRHIGFIKQLP